MIKWNLHHEDIVPVMASIALIVVMALGIYAIVTNI